MKTDDFLYVLSSLIQYVFAFLTIYTIMRTYDIWNLILKPKTWFQPTLSFVLLNLPLCRYRRLWNTFTYIFTDWMSLNHSILVKRTTIINNNATITNKHFYIKYNNIDWYKVNRNTILLRFIWHLIGFFIFLRRNDNNATKTL